MYVLYAEGTNTTDEEFSGIIMQSETQDVLQEFITQTEINQTGRGSIRFLEIREI